MLLGKVTIASRPYKLGLTLKCNKYTPEKRAWMRRYAAKDGPSKAFSWLEIARYWDLINYVISAMSFLG